MVEPVYTKALTTIIPTRFMHINPLQNFHIRHAYTETISMLEKSFESHDQFALEHVKRVAKYAGWLGKALSWTGTNLNRLRFGALLHDIGKIFIPDLVLNKLGPLSEDEWCLMKQHPVRGANLIKEIPLLRETVPYILYHHEKWDGSGYPYGLKGKEIPIEGRMIAIADAFDALTSTRSYRPALPLKEVIQQMQRGIGTYFDPYLMGVFSNAVLPRYMAALP